MIRESLSTMAILSHLRKYMERREMGATENSLYQGKHRSSMMAPAVNYTHRIAADMDPLWAAQNQRRMTVGTKTLRTEHRRGNSVILLVCLTF